MGSETQTTSLPLLEVAKFIAYVAGLPLDFIRSKEGAEGSKTEASAMLDAFSRRHVRSRNMDETTRQEPPLIRRSWLSL